jgi:flagellar biogenesis protein FliO
MLPGSIGLSLGALALVLALIALAHHAVRGGWIRLPASPTGTSRRLSVVETLPLDTRRRVTLLRCDNRHVAILTGGTRDLVIGWLPEHGA